VGPRAGLDTVSRRKICCSYFGFICNDFDRHEVMPLETLDYENENGKPPHNLVLFLFLDYVRN
jgi:hypothetical protein